MFETASAGRGGSGRSLSLRRSIAELAREGRVAISGGLTPENVGAVRARGAPSLRGRRSVSGVESDGAKDRGKMRAFVRAVEEADAQA